MCVFWQHDEVVVEDVKEDDEDDDEDDDDNDEDEKEDGAEGCFLFFIFFGISVLGVCTTLFFDGVLFVWFLGFIRDFVIYLLDLVDLWGLLYWVCFECWFEVGFRALF